MVLIPFPIFIFINYILPLRTCKDREIEKTKRIKENIVKDKIKFTMECSQDEMILLDTKILTAPIADKKVVIATDMYSKKTDTH